MQLTFEQIQKACFRVDDPGLKAGDVIEHGRWGRILQEAGESHQQFERENILEQVRAAEFPEKPSRLTGTFTFPCMEHADKFLDWRWNNVSRQHMYEVVPVDPDAAYHLGYMLCIPPFQENDPVAISRAYWSFKSPAFGFDFSKESFVEIVYDCPLQVVRVCHEPLTKEYSEAMSNILLKGPSKGL